MIKIIKLMIASLLIFAALLFIGEVTTLNALYSLESKFPMGEYKLPLSNTNNSIAFTAKEVSARMDCEIFFIDFSKSSLFETRVVIYCTPEIKSTLHKKLGLKSKTYQSLFIGNITIEYHPIPDISSMKGIESIYFMGSDEAIYETHRQLSEELGEVSFRMEGYDQRYSIATILVCFVFLMIILLLTIYDANLQKKETLVRVVFGHNKWNCFWKNIIVDSFFYLGIFIGGSSIVGSFSYLEDSLYQIALFCFILICLNGICYHSLLHINYGQLLKGERLNKKIWSINYILKWIVTFGMVLCVLLYAQSKEATHKQKNSSEFWNYFSEYSFCQFEGPFEIQDVHAYRENYRQLNEAIYQTYYDKTQPVILTKYVNDTDSNVPIIYANANAAMYLEKVLPEWNKNVENKVFIFYPEYVFHNSKIRSYVESAFLQIEGYALENYEECSVKGVYEVLSINADYQEYFEIITEPIIILNLQTPSDTMDSDEDKRRYSMYRNILYKIDENIKQEIKTSFQLEKLMITPCSQQQEQWIFKNQLYRLFFGGFSLLLILLEGFIMFTLIDLEFKINERELSLKKVFGYSFLQRYGSLFLLPSLLTMVVTLACAWISNYYDFGSLIIVFGVGFSVLVIEIITTLLFLKRLERQTVSCVLKGGAL